MIIKNISLNSLGELSIRLSKGDPIRYCGYEIDESVCNWISIKFNCKCTEESEKEFKTYSSEEIKQIVHDSFLPKFEHDISKAQKNLEYHKQLFSLL